jgi:2-methylcitrate dehydratase PrpD
MSSENDTLAKYLAKLVLTIRDAQIQDADRGVVRQHLLDGIASALVGCRAKLFADLTESTNVGESAATTDRSPQDLAMLWAVAVNGSVFEDGSREGACHPAAAVVPALMPFAEGRPWEIVDKAIIAGYDVMVRVARCGNPQFTRRGFHPTSITAPFAAAAVVSQLLGYDLHTTENALCLAAMGSSGLMSSFKQGSTQPLQVGWGVRSGVVAALLAGSGNLGYDRVFEEGFFPAYLGSDTSAQARISLAFGYAVKGSYLKPYPGCRHMHATLDAFNHIATRYRFTPEQISKIMVATYKVALETEIDSLNKRGDAYFNIPYSVAARCVLGRNDYESFDEKHFATPSIRGVMNKVSLSVDPEMDKRYPGQRGSKVEVRLSDGQVLTQTVEFALGEPENPLPLSATKQKLRDCAKGLVPVETVEEWEKLLEVPGGRADLRTLSNVILQIPAFA